ncbi:MAG: hypothetical protein D6705_09200 [Deltaproteobacteria bacterium]|nr:MAG: hypothetical protein D6705_09200 [Deltaproteobacteria bacterium]
MTFARRPRTRCTAGGHIAAATILLGAGCIIPDHEIVIEGVFTNPGAVRIVERIPVGEDADLACKDASDEVNTCPQVPAAGHLPSGWIPTPLCVCPEGASDALAFGEVRVYAEDPDTDDDGEAKDDLFAALLLDFDPFLHEPSDRVAYRNYLQPDRPAERVVSSEYENVIGRADPQLRFFRIVGSSGLVDLCNDNEGSKLSPGIHSLKIVVTDRPWFTPVLRDETGEPVRDPDTGDLVYLPQLVGHPDLAAGATYDTMSWVFSCGEGEECACNSVGP